MRSLNYRHLQRGVALPTALIFCLVLSLFIGGSLLVSQTNYSLSFQQTRSEGAILLADAGVNDELRVIANGASSTTQAGFSSQPVDYHATNPNSATATYPGETHAIYGRPSTVPSWYKPDPNGLYPLASAPYYCFWVYATNDPTTNTPWDGKQNPFYIVSRAADDGNWRKVTATCRANSFFNQYGLFADGTGNAFVGNGNAQVDVTGLLGTNGTNQLNHITGTTVYNAGGTTSLKASNTTSGTVLSNPSVVVFPTTATMLKRYLGVLADTDAQAYSILGGQNALHLSTPHVYQFKANVNQTLGNITSANVLPYTFSGNVLDSSSNGSWKNATAFGGKTSLIFEPGDYYFTQLSASYMSGLQIFLDPQAFASGGTAGQIRFWVENPSPPANNAPADVLGISMTETYPAGTTTPDPGNFRIFYGNDSANGSMLEIQAPDTNTTCLIWGGIYAVTKPAVAPYLTNSALKGAEVQFFAQDNGNTYVKLAGSCICDIFSSWKENQIGFALSNSTVDLASSAYVVNYSDGG